MARFYKLNDSWINIDMIVSMYYDTEDNKTYIFSADSPDEHFTHEGDIINDILNANNDLTMREKHYINSMSDKFKSVLASILARIDSLSKNVDVIRRTQK